MILRLICLLANIIPFAFADVAFTSPAAGASITGTTISIAWQDSGTAPALTDLSSYQIFLCGGGNTDNTYTQLVTLVSQGDFTTGSTAQGTITLGLGAPIENAYFLKVISVATGGTVVNYSDRFSIPAMIGTFQPAVEQAAKAITGTAGPATQNNVVSPPNPAAASSQGGNFAVPFTMQTGVIRYAPMPPMPVTKITAKAQSMLYPTSSYVLATGPLPSPVAITTYTLSQTFSASSIENQVSAAAPPTDTAMARFLNRWKD